MGLFGIAYPKFIGNIDTTQDEVSLPNSVVLKDEPILDSFSNRSVRTGKKIFTNAGKHWIFQVKVHLWKYADPELKYLELKSHEGKKVYLARHSDGDYFVKTGGVTAEFYLESVSETYLDEYLKKDIVILKFISVDYITTFESPTSWIEVQPAGDVNKNWYGADLSANGKYMFASVNGGRFYRSEDYGETWQETQPYGDSDRGWHTVSCSQDGKYVFVGTITGGKVFKSSDYGVTWTEITPYGYSLAWGNVAMDYVGEKIFLGSNGSLFRSVNGGASFSLIYPVPATSEDWYGGAMTPDGNKIIVSGHTFIQRAFISEDGGSSWTMVNPSIGVATYTGACCNSNFMRLGLVTRGANGRVYISADGGTTWTERFPMDDNLPHNYYSINMDATGRIVIVAINGGGVYVSYDYGVNWIREIDEIDRAYHWAELNTFGNKGMAYVYGGRIFIKK